MDTSMGTTARVLGLLGLGLAACATEPVDASLRQPLYVDSDHVWDPATIPVCWENGTASTVDGQKWVRDAVEGSWGHVADVAFTGWGDCTSSSSGVRIKIDDVAPNTNSLGTHLDGDKNGMELNFTFGNWSPSCRDTLETCIRGIAIHEFGHALGFAHEQNRPDTPSWCDDAQGHDGDLTLGAWDESSIMNYCNPDWNNGGHLSDGDVAGVQTIYGERSDRKIYPATLCEQVGTETTVSYKDTGRLYNGTTSSVTVICPVLRDDVEAGPLGGAWVYIDDNHPSENVTCALRSYAATGTSYDSASVTSSGSGATTQYSLASENVAGYDGGRYALVCTLPPMSGGVASGLAAYSVREGT